MIALVIAWVIAAQLAAAHDPPRAIESRFSSTELDMVADPKRSEWTAITPAIIDHDMWGGAVPGRLTEVRSRWTSNHLYLLYSCPYDALNLRPGADTTIEASRLWHWDVAEAFIGSTEGPVGRYREFQVSPQGEWMDLGIDRDRPAEQEGVRWQSGMVVAARIDRKASIWYGLMRIPFSAIDARAPAPGRTLRIGLYRIAGIEPSRTYYAWAPTGKGTFHAPEAFGTLTLR